MLTAILRSVHRSCCEFPRCCGLIACVLAAGTLLTHYAVKYGLNVPPSKTGDEFSYDSIGWNLARGTGFAEGGRDAEFFRPYDQAGAFSETDIANRMIRQPELVAHRPPLFPFVLAGLNTLFGRQFQAVRVLNVLASAGTCGLLVWYLAKTRRSAAALIAFGMYLVVDTRTRLYGRAILTEATATFLTTVATLLLLQLSHRTQLRTVVWLGIVAGLMVLDRTMFALWLPGLVLLVFVLSGNAAPESSAASATPRWRSGLWMSGIFLTVTVLVVLPWGIRNVRVLGAMMPLGTQGMSQLPAGFSDHAVEQRGVWDLRPSQLLAETIDGESMTRLERDVARAERGKTVALSWIREHPLTAVGLAGMKIWQEYRPRTLPESVICLCAVTGLVLSLQQTETRIFLTLHAVNAFAIGCTWSVEGRFVVPLMFSIHVPAAVAVARPFRTWMGRREG